MKKTLITVFIICNILFSCGEDEEYTTCLKTNDSICNIDEYCNTDENQKNENGEIIGYCSKADSCFEDTDCLLLTFACTSQGYCKPGERTENDSNTPDEDTGSTQEEDKTPPSVISKSPEGDNELFNIEGDVKITFSETIMTSTLHVTLTDGSTDKELICDSSDKISFQCPYSDLKKDFTYTIMIEAGVRDNSIYENQMDALIWTFKTFAENSCEEEPCSTDGPFTIPKVGELESTINVANFNDNLLLVNLNAEIVCENNNDCSFDIYIKAPDGTMVQLRDRSEEVAAFTETITIKQSLSEFKDISKVNGDWTLVVESGVIIMVGTLPTLSNWSIQLESY